MSDATTELVGSARLSSRRIAPGSGGVPDIVYSMGTVLLNSFGMGCWIADRRYQRRLCSLTWGVGQYVY